MITGEQFNERYENVKFVKLTNKSCQRNGTLYKEGLNEDFTKFNEKDICGPGGMYFCRYGNFRTWISYGLALQFVNNKTRTICLEAVKQNINAIEFVANKYKLLCKIRTFSLLS